MYILLASTWKYSDFYLFNLLFRQIFGNGEKGKLGRNFYYFLSVVMFCPFLFCPSDNFEHCLALPTSWRPAVRALFYWYLLCDPRRCDNNWEVGSQRRVSASGALHVVTGTKQTWIKHHNTKIFSLIFWYFWFCFRCSCYFSAQEHLTCDLFVFQILVRKGFMYVHILKCKTTSFHTYLLYYLKGQWHKIKMAWKWYSLIGLNHHCHRILVRIFLYLSL